MGNAGAGIGGLLMMVIWLFLFIAAVMAIFIPFWVYRIRNEVIGTNKRLDALIKLSGGNPKTLRPKVGNFSNPTKTCHRCGTENRIEDMTCVGCGRAPI